ncbi:MAG: hypothetical protein WAX89_02110 [Alphaproteobacteria bacterium]
MTWLCRSILCVFCLMGAFSHASSAPANKENKPDPAADLNNLMQQRIQNSITIGGKNVMEEIRPKSQFELLPLPAALQTPEYMHYMRNRLMLESYAHNPTKGDIQAPVTIVELSDLGCLPCMEKLKAFDKDLADMPNLIRLVHVHAPVPTAAPSQLAGFYGKMAQSVGKFWEYRTFVQNNKETDANAYFNGLRQLGMDDNKIRMAAIRDARRFYRELDADAALIRQAKLKHSPMWLVSGVQVAPSAIPLDKLKHVVEYDLQTQHVAFEPFAPAAVVDPTPAHGAEQAPAAPNNNNGH